MWRSQTEENTGPRGPQQVFNFIFWEILWLLHTTPLWAKPNTQDWNKLIKAPCNRNYHRLNSTGCQGNKGNINLNVELFQISSKWVVAGTWSYSAQSRTGLGQWRQRVTLNTRLICCVPWAWEQNNHHIFFIKYWNWLFGVKQTKSGRMEKEESSYWHISKWQLFCGDEALHCHRHMTDITRNTSF